MAEVCTDGMIFDEFNLWDAIENRKLTVTSMVRDVVVRMRAEEDRRDQLVLTRLHRRQQTSRAEVRVLPVHHS